MGLKNCRQGGNQISEEENNNMLEKGMIEMDILKGVQLLV